MLSFSRNGFSATDREPDLGRGPRRMFEALVRTVGHLYPFLHSHTPFFVTSYFLKFFEKSESFIRNLQQVEGESRHATLLLQPLKDNRLSRDLDIPGQWFVRSSPKCEIGKMCPQCSDRVGG